MCNLSNVAPRVLKAFTEWRGSPAILRVMEEFPGLEVYVAGGAVRNLLLDADARVRDFDLFLGGSSVDRALERLAQAGRMNHGVYGNIHWWPCGDEPVRGDLILVSRFQSNGPCRNILDVLNQFDFTGNAVGVDLRTGAVLDPQNGVRDMRRRLMRAVRFDTPDVPISPGHVLRRTVCLWYRILHYAAALQLRIEPATMRWLQAHSEYRRYREAFIREFKTPHPDALLIYDRCFEARGLEEEGAGARGCLPANAYA